MNFGDTIFALSSGGLPSGVAVVRISGQAVRFVCETVLRQLPSERMAKLMPVFGSDGQLLDKAIVLRFEAPRSFTGEDCLELHLHGGRAVVAAVLSTLSHLPGLRAAEAGEFTRRAFGNGKLDLTQAEALADLIDADTEAQRRFAMANTDGRQADLYRSWRARLLHARAMLEAELDFADEGDVPGSVSATIWEDMRALADEIGRHASGYDRAEMIRDGFDVVIAGAPNAGKSSLLNALAKRDAAIVSEHAGTTRDLIEVVLDLDGYKVRVTDTAGLRETADPVERMGVDRARERTKRAHLVLLLTDMADPVRASGPDRVPIVQIGTKADIAPDVAPDIGYELRLSTVDGTGVNDLLTMIVERAKAAAGGTDLLPTRLRHVASLERAIDHLTYAVNGELAPLELRAEELRLAGNCLAQITGDIDVEDLLGAIFSSFCIGK